MRFSDLTKKNAGAPEPGPKKQAGAAPVPERKKEKPAGPVQAAPGGSYKGLDASAREVYARVLDQAGSFLKGVDQPYTEKYEAVLATCGLVIETLNTNGVLLTYTNYSTADDYLRAHTANTTIVALALGLAAGLESSELSLLGFCTMAHDIGMTEYSSLYNRADRLNENEFAEMSLHAEAGVAKLDRIVDIDRKIKERAGHIVLQTHERADGSGYPDRLSKEVIDPLAQFICIADAYEAMTHPRAWRDAISPPEAVKELVENEGQGFSSKAVKALISAVSIYPPGSLVELSSGEIGRVLRVSRGFLTKPLVEILLAPDFSQVNPQLIDLFEHPLTSIERAVSFREIAARNPKYAARLEMARWWVEW
ncbi:MAG: HD domain-containing protein [Elusimicrobiota bacterium]|nr:HD domain-containing protein [Elusimicrobiota bacterium]